MWPIKMINTGKESFEISNERVSFMNFPPQKKGFVKKCNVADKKPHLPMVVVFTELSNPFTYP